MFRFIGTIIRLVSMVSTLMLAIDQIRRVMRSRKMDEDINEETRRAA